MKDNQFYVHFLISNEMLDRYPTLRDIALKDICKQLTEKLFCEIQNGEKIVCLKDAETKNYSLNMTELNQEMCITDLVRCKDCIYSNGTLKYCSIDHWVNEDGTSFCSYGEKSEPSTIKMDLNEVNNGT